MFKFNAPPVIIVEKIKLHWALIFIAAWLFLAASPLGAQPQEEEVSQIPEAVIDPGSGSGHFLVVDKSKQESYYYRYENGHYYLLKKMACSTGEKQGDKMVQDDRKTPEGFYIFNQKMVKRELTDLYGVLAYPMDYPNFWDKHQGRGGYGIWTHGINKPMKNYDSLGCIELKNTDIIELEPSIALYETPILVYETVKLRPVAEASAESKRLKDFLESWRQAWVSKNQQAYRAKYDSKFVNSDNRTYEGWMKHKEQVAQNYKQIKIDLKNVRIFRHREVIVILFEQNYSGDGRFTSKGLKRLYVQPSGSSYKIVGEKFMNAPDASTNKWLTAEEKEAVVLAASAPPVTETAAASVKAVAPGGPPLAQAQAQASGLPQEAGASPAPKEAAVAQLNISPEPAQPATAPQAPPPLAAAKAEAVVPEADSENQQVRQIAADLKTGGQPDSKAPAVKANDRETLQGALKDWANAWESKNKSAYFKYYDEKFVFKDKGMNLAAFKKYRTNLMDKARKIEVKVEKLQLAVEAGKAKVTFVQVYRSDNYQDKGRKTLLWEKKGDSWKIVEESWQAL